MQLALVKSRLIAFKVTDGYHTRRWSPLDQPTCEHVRPVRKIVKFFRHILAQEGSALTALCF
jgi:hypothetical protein